MVTEWCDKGSLFDVLNNTKESFNFKRVVKIALQICKGMCYLHQRSTKIIHRDLKSLNVLINSADDAKVADFGLTVMKEASAKTTRASVVSVSSDVSGVFKVHKKESSASMSNAADNFDIVGTAQWMAPEVMLGSNYGNKIDIYAFGILLTELVTRKMPFKDKYVGMDFVDGVVDEGEE